MRIYHIKNTNFNVFWLLRIAEILKKSVMYWVIGLVNTVDPLTQKSYQKYYEKEHAANSHRAMMNFQF